MQESVPDWPLIHRELRRPSITLDDLWIQHRERMGFAHSFAEFCWCYRNWRSGLNLLMRQEQTAGGIVYVFYGRFSNSCLVVDTDTGEVFPAFLFVAVLGASSYCYAETVATDDIDSWIDCHLRAFHFFGGAARIVIPRLVGTESNLASHDRYQEMVGAFNARVMMFSDAFLKSQVEIDVAVRWFAASLRNRPYTSLPELNAQIFNLVQELNARSFAKLPGSRKDWFDSFERCSLTALAPLPCDRKIRLRKQVRADSYINVDGHYYSVPCQLAGQWLDVCVTPTRITFLLQEKRITSHKRMEQAAGKTTTKKTHVRKPSNKTASGWSPDRVLRWAQQIGPATTYLITSILAHAKHSQSGVRACLGLLSLEEQYGRDRLESACRLAATCKSWTVNSIRRTLKLGLDQNSVQLTIPLSIIPPKKRR